MAMVMDESGNIYFLNTVVAVYLTVVARALRGLDEGRPPDTALAALNRALRVEQRLASPDASAQEQIWSLHSSLVRLIRDMPSDEDL